MNDLAQDTLRRLQRETGITLDPVSDYEHIHGLVELAERTLDAESSPACEALLMPSVRVGDVVLFRLSHGAKEFYKREILTPFRDDVSFVNIAYAWCMAHSREPELLWNIAGDKRAIRKAVEKWGRTLCIPEDAILAAIEKLHLTVAALYSRADGRTRPKSDLSRWIKELAVQTGRSVEDLVWRCPEEEIILLLTQHPDETGHAPDPDAPSIRALRDFREAETELRAILEARK